MTPKKTLFLVHLSLLIVTLIYGTTFVVAKGLMPKFIKPFGFITVRVSVALIMITLVQKIFINEKVRKREDLLRLALCGLLGVAANMLFFFQGLSMTSPINASLIMTTTPIVVLLFAALLINERITVQKGIGVVLGAIGAIMMIIQSSEAENVQSSWLGDVFVFINAASYGLYLVLVRPLMQKYHPLTVVRWTFTFGSIIVIPFGIQQLLQVNWGSADSDIWFALFYVVLGTTFFAYLINAWALRYVKSSVVGSYIYLQPVFATLTALWLNAYSLSVAHVIFGLMIFAGVYLVSSRINLLEKLRNTFS